MALSNAPKKRNHIWGNLVKVLLSVALLALVLRQVAWSDVRAALSGARLEYLAGAFAIHLFGMVLRAYRWQVLLEALDIHVSIVRLTYLYFVGAFFNNLLPTGFGGDVVRSYELSRRSERTAEAIGTVLVDRATGLLALFMMALVALAFSCRMVEPQIALLIVVLALGGWVAAWLFLQRGVLDRLGIMPLLRRFRQLERVYDAVQGCGTRAMIQALIVSLVFNSSLITVHYGIALALGVRLPLGLYFVFIPIISLLLMFPLSLNGLGVREGAFVVLFGQAGVLPPIALTMSLMVYAMNAATGLIGGILYLLEGAASVWAKNRPSQAPDGQKELETDWKR